MQTFRIVFDRFASIYHLGFAPEVEAVLCGFETDGDFEEFLKAGVKRGETTSLTNVIALIRCGKTRNLQYRIALDWRNVLRFEGKTHVFPVEKRTVYPRYQAGEHDFPISLEWLPQRASIVTRAGAPLCRVVCDEGSDDDDDSEESD